MKELAYIFIFIGCALFFISSNCLIDLKKIINRKFNSTSKTMPDNQKLKSEFASLKSEFSFLKSEFVSKKNIESTLNIKNQEINQNIHNLKNELNMLKKQISNFTPISNFSDHRDGKITPSNSISYLNKIEKLNNKSSNSELFDIENSQFRESHEENIKNKNLEFNLETILKYVNSKENNNINNYIEMFYDFIIQDEKRGYYLIQMKEYNKYNYYLLCKVGRDYENYQKVFQKKNHGKENVIIKIINPTIIDLSQEEFVKMKRENKVDMEVVYNTKHQQGLVEVE